jgi:quinoprotein glucose dehydrogenase
MDDLIDFTPELRAEAEARVANVTLGPLFTPPSTVDDDGVGGTMMMPSQTGGANWEGGAFDPETGVIYIASKTDGGTLTLGPSNASDMNYVQSFGGGGRGRGGGRGGRGGAAARPQRSGLPLIKPPWGRITAIDLNTGEHLWMQANGDATERVKNNPFLEGVEVGRWGKATRAGILVTRTLVLAGEGYGGDPHFYAYDKATGEIIADLEIPGTQTSLPMTYMHEDEQYVVFTVGGGGQPAQLIAMTLP